MNSSADLFHTLGQADVLQILVIMVGAWGLIYAGGRILPWVAARTYGRLKFYILSVVPVYRLGIIFGALILVITKVIEPTVENVMVLIGTLGLGIGFAFKEYISSLLAGVVTLYERPYRPGDWIEINGVYGEVRAINMRCAEIVTPDDTVVVIPHLSIWNQMIYNSNDGGRNLQCSADFYLQPQHDASKVVGVLRDVALTSVYLQIKQPVNVIVVEKPWGTRYRLKAYPIDPRQQFNFITDLTVRGKGALSGIGVEFCSSPVVEGRVE
jgi:small-conductance mechanosensitive channel